MKSEQDFCVCRWDWGGSTSSRSNGYVVSFHLRNPVQNVLHDKEHKTNTWTSEYLNEYLLKEGKEHQSD